MKRWTIKLLSRLSVVAFVPLMLTSGVAGAADWSVVPSPSPGVTANELNSVAAVATSAAWAVGDITVANGASRTLVEQWNGTRWSVVPSPSPSAAHNILHDVAAVSSSDAWAVGWFNNARDIPRTLIEHWDGTSWRIVPSPNAGFNDFLYGVTAASATDAWAVGQFSNASGFYQTLMEHWNGTTWHIVPSPNVGTHDNVLNGATAISATDAWAVGDFLDHTSTSHTLIEHWDGTTWRVEPSPAGAPTPNVLNAVRAVSATDVWAVGQATTQTLTEHWDGTAWSVVPSPNIGADNNLLRGVSIVSPTNIWAVGFDVNNGLTLVEHWDGTAWSITPSPNPGPSLNSLNGVATDPLTGQTWAVGVFYNASGVSQTLIEFHP